MANTLEVVIKAIDNATGPVGKIQSSFASLNKVLGAVGVGLSAAALISFLKDATKEAVESEKATSRLSHSVNSLGMSYNALEDRIQDQIQATSNYAIVQDELVSDTLQTLILQTGNVGDSLKNLNLVFDLSRAANIDASTAAVLFQKGIQGEIEALGRYFPALKRINENLGENASKTLKAEAVLKFFNERVSGATGSMGELEARSLRVSKALGDLKEAAGFTFDKAIDKTMSFLKWLDNLDEKVNVVLRKIPLLSNFADPLAKPDMAKFGTALGEVNKMLSDNILKLEADNKKAKEKSDADRAGAVALGTLIQAQARYDQVITPLAAKLAAIGISFKDLGIDQAALRTSVEAQTKAQEAIDPILKSNQEHLGGLIAAQSRYNVVIEPFITHLAEMGISLKDLGIDMSSLMTSLDDQNNALKVGTEAWGKLQEAMGEVIKDKAVKDWAKKQINSWDDLLTRINLTTDAIGVGLGNAFGNMIVSGQSFGEAMKNVFRSWAAEAINQITQVLIKFALFKLFEVGTGGPLELLFKHDGGEIMHQGGILKAHSGLNLAHDEVPIIAQRGEAVLNRRAVRQLGTSGVNALNQGQGGRNVTVVNNVSGPAIFDKLSMAKWTRRQLKAINAEMMRYA